MTRDILYAVMVVCGAFIGLAPIAIVFSDARDDGRYHRD